MSAPTDFRPVIDLLVEAWAYRRTALDCGDMAGIALYEEAFDRLFDRWLIERPELRCTPSK